MGPLPKALASEYADLLGWRDQLYAEARRS
jgi:hypothetical protein